MTGRKPILVLDFDGVLHSYTSGWQGADVIPDPPVPGAQEFCRGAVRHFEVHIVSARCAYPGGPRAIFDWLLANGFPGGMEIFEGGVKPLAFLTLDDRALRFDGR